MHLTQGKRGDSLRKGQGMALSPAVAALGHRQTRERSLAVPFSEVHALGKFMPSGIAWEST